MSGPIRPGATLADRYRLDDLLSESGSGRFWRAHDRVLQRHVALHVMATDDPRVPLLLDAAHRSASVIDPRVLRVLDAEQRDDICFVVNEWGYGTSLDIALANNGALQPRRAAWLVSEVADSAAIAHAQGVAHGRLVPENVLIDETGHVRIIGLCVDAAMHGLAEGAPQGDLADLAGLLHAALTGRWAGTSSSAVPAVPHGQGGRALRPRQVRAGVPRVLDDLVDAIVNPATARTSAPTTAVETCAVLTEFVGDPSGIASALARANPLRPLDLVVLPQVPDIGLRSDPPAAAQTPEPVAVAVAVEPAADEARPEEVPEDPEPAPRPEDPIGERIRHVTSPYGDKDPASEGSQPAAVGTSGPQRTTGTETTEATETTGGYDDSGDRPLFAPTPPGGGPDRTRRTAGRPRPDGGHSDTDGHWAFDTSPTGTTRPVPEDPETGADTRVPGRRSLRVAAVVALVALVLLAIAVATSHYGLLQSDGVLSGPAPTAASTVITGLSAEVFLAAGDQVTATDAALAVDDDLATVWSTGVLEEQPGPGAAARGVGLLLDLGTVQPVAQVDLQLVGEPTNITIYVAAEKPLTLSALEPAVDVRAAAQETVGLRPRTAGRYVLLWLTSLPQVDGGFEGALADVTLHR
ncbi:MAG: protein kinase family protein [Nocardioides sp.]|nr:protein kinase family protein [Nocardioides sp.]